MFVRKFVRIMKLLLKKDTLSHDESMDQDIAVAEILWIKKNGSLQQNPKFDI